MTLLLERMHMFNILRFGKLIEIVELLANSYNPPDERISIPNLHILLSEADRIVKKHNNNVNDMYKTVSARENAFTEFTDDCVQSINYLSKTFPEGPIYVEAKNILHNIRERGLKEKQTMWATYGNKEKFKDVPKPIIIQSMGLKSRLEAMAELLELLEEAPNYKPTQPAHQISSMKEKYENVKELYVGSLAAFSKFSMSINKQNHILYDTKSGLKATADLVKEYIKSVHGKKSDAYKNISQVDFPNPKSM